MKHGGIPMHLLPAKYQDQIARQLGTAPATENQPVDRLRQKKSPKNKTEDAFETYLRASFPAAQIMFEAVTFKLANGTRYTPDFLVSTTERPAFYEVKGFMRDDAGVKIKVAADRYQWADFFLVSRIQGRWNIQKILAI